MIETLSRSLADAALHGAAAMTVITALVLLLRHRTSAATRHLLWSLGLVSLLAVWVLAPAPARWQVSLPDVSIRQEASPVVVRIEHPTPPPLQASAEEARGPAVPDVERPAIRGVAPVAARVRWEAVLVIVWLVGALVVIAPLVVGVLRTRRLVRSAKPLEAGEVRALAELSGAGRELARVGLRLTDEIRVPATAGILHSAILLPARFTEWPRPRQREVLLHELAHVRRRDVPMRLVARLAVALHWFDPLAWIAERWHRLESERACDDAVLQHGGDRVHYAESLLSMARSLGAAATPPATVGVFGTTHLERRIRSILQESRRRVALGRAKRWGLVALTLSAALPLGGLGITRSAGETLTVARDGSGRFQDIQAAVDAAADHDTVRIAPGTYEERVTITKPLTLEGAGWERTALTAGYRPEDGDGPLPTLLVRGAADVVVKGFRLAQPGVGADGAVMPGSIVAIDGAEVRLTDCAIADSPGSGIDVRGESVVEIRGCLVAAVQATGIQVVGAEPEVHVVECDVRNCRHRGITVGAGNHSTTIERCRISRSAWHGIRYDDAAPTITGNLIFDNERSGIYASGRTSGVVRGNLFHRNGMTGMSCWFRAADRIEGNTFVGDVRAGLEVLGTSEPVIHGNVFVDLKVAVRLGNIGSDSPAARSTGEVELANNVFWNVEQRVGGPAVPATLADAEAHGNRAMEPGFVAPAKLDYTLAAESPARRAGAGAAEPPSFDSPWPELEQERSLVAKKSERERRQASAPDAQSAYRIANPWIEQILQIRDAATREIGIAAMRTALESDDPVRQLAGLIAFARTGEVSFDRVPFRALILPLCSSLDDAAQVQAFYALNAAGREPSDRELLLAALREPSPAMRESGTHLLMLFFERDLTGEAADASLRLLDSDDERARREAMRGLWGASASLEIQSRLLDIAKLPVSRHDAIYYGLSTLQNKSREVVEFLLAVLEDPNPNDSGRALWGLRQGVAPSEHRLVADRIVQLFEARNDGRTREQCLELLRRYGDDDHLPFLRELADNELASDALRNDARAAVDAIERR